MSKIINDIGELQKFINILPDLEDHKTYRVVILSRDKYKTNVKSNSSNLIHVFDCSKNQIIQNLKSFEDDIYPTLDEGDKEGLCVFIDTRVVNYKKVYKLIIEKLVDNMSNGKFTKPETLIKSYRSKCRVTNKLMMFDIDGSEEDIKKDILQPIVDEDLLNIGSVSYVKTTNGIHLLIDCKKNKTHPRWLVNLTNILLKLPYYQHNKIDLLLLPGCKQNKHIPTYHVLNNEKDQNT